jgi:hypothetical protein
MPTKKNISYKHSLGFFEALFLIFMTLKLTDVIDWSWWFITLPLWGPFTIALLIFVGFIMKLFIKR